MGGSPITLTQLGSWISGHGLKRDYVSIKEMSPYARLAVICSEDQLFPDHNGFDWKHIEKAMKNNEKDPTVSKGPPPLASR
nr:transglycosylase domain-containing protein [Paraflavitalea speifideiaquila]